MDVLNEDRMQENIGLNRKDIFVTELNITKEEIDDLSHYRDNFSSIDGLFDSLGRKDKNKNEMVLTESLFENGSKVSLALSKYISVDNSEELGINLKISNKDNDVLLSAPFYMLETSWPPFFGVYTPLYNPKTNSSEIYVVNSKDFEYNPEF